MANNKAYTEEEKEMLVQFIKNHPIVENKQTDATNIKKKTAAWNKICEEYNAGNVEVKRNVIQLKRCWDKIKRHRKSILAEERRERMRTGGGPAIPEKNVIPDVDNIVPHLTYEIKNYFYSDGIMECSATSNDYPGLCQIADATDVIIEDTEGNFAEVAETPIENINLPHTICSNTKAGRQFAFDLLMDARHENVKLEQHYMKISHDMQMKIWVKQLEVEEERKNKAEYDTEYSKTILEAEIEKLKFQKLKNEELVLDIEIKKRQLLQ